MDKSKHRRKHFVNPGFDNGVRLPTADFHDYPRFGYNGMDMLMYTLAVAALRYSSIKRKVPQRYMKCEC